MPFWKITYNYEFRYVIHEYEEPWPWSYSEKWIICKYRHIGTGSSSYSLVMKLGGLSDHILSTIGKYLSFVWEVNYLRFTGDRERGREERDRDREETQRAKGTEGQKDRQRQTDRQTGRKNTTRFREFNEETKCSTTWNLGQYVGKNEWGSVNSQAQLFSL